MYALRRDKFPFILPLPANRIENEGLYMILPLVESWAKKPDTYCVSHLTSDDRLRLQTYLLLCAGQFLQPFDPLSAAGRISGMWLSAFSRRYKFSECREANQPELEIDVDS